MSNKCPDETAQKPSVPKFGRKFPHLRCDSHTSFKVKRSKVRVTGGRGILCRPNPAATLLVVKAPWIFYELRRYTYKYFTYLFTYLLTYLLTYFQLINESVTISVECCVFSFFYSRAAVSVVFPPCCPVQVFIICSLLCIMYFYLNK